MAMKFIELQWQKRIFRSGEERGEVKMKGEKTISPNEYLN